jgi:hypothetical protein
VQQHQQLQQQRAAAVSSIPTTSASPRPATTPYSVPSVSQPTPDASSQHHGTTPQGQHQLISSADDLNLNSNRQTDSLDDLGRSCTPKSPGGLSGSPPFSPNVSDQELQAWLNQKDLGDDLLKGCKLDFDDIDLMDDDELTGPNGLCLPSNNNNMDDKFDINNRVRTISTGKPALEILRNGSRLDRSSPVEPESRELHIGLTAKELQKRCKGLGLKGVTNFNILKDNAPPPNPPEPPKVRQI